tara:strand:+ start:4785 stop:6047 length:1263 start_codon:yes stop_codon:yes gene_type:complete
LKFLKSEFNKNVIKLISGTTIAQAIPILISPILARLYTPQNFGDFALFTSFVSILAVLTTFRYEVAIVLPKLKKTAINVFFLCCISTLLISFFTFIIVLFFGDKILISFGYYNIVSFKYLIPISIFLIGIYQTSDYFFNRLKQYYKMSLIRIFQSLGIGIFGLIFGIITFTSNGLIIANILGFTLSFIIIVFFLKSTLRSYFKKINYKDLKFVAKKYSSLFFFGTPAIFVSTFASQSFFILSSSYIGPVILGYFYMIYRVVGIPSTIIGNSIGQVFYQDIAKFKFSDSFDKIWTFFKQILFQSFILHLILYIFLILFFVPIFGSQWSDATEFIIYFIIIGFFSYIFAPLSQLFNYYNIQKLNLLWQSLWLSTNFLVFYIYYYSDLSLKTFMIIYTLKQSILYAFGILYFLYYSKNQKKNK